MRRLTDELVAHGTVDPVRDTLTIFEELPEQLWVPEMEDMIQKLTDRLAELLA